MMHVLFYVCILGNGIGDDGSMFLYIRCACSVATITNTKIESEAYIKPVDVKNESSDEAIVVSADLVVNAIAKILAMVIFEPKNELNTVPLDPVAEIVGTLVDREVVEDDNTGIAEFVGFGNVVVTALFVVVDIGHGVCEKCVVFFIERIGSFESVGVRYIQEFNRTTVVCVFAVYTGSIGVVPSRKCMSCIQV